MIVDDEDLLYNDKDDSNIERIYKLVSLLVNRIIFDSIKDHKITNHKNMVAKKHGSS